MSFAVRDLRASLSDVGRAAMQGKTRGRTASADRRHTDQPMRMFHELSARLPDIAIVAADSGSAANWYARHLHFRGGVRGSLSVTLATTRCPVRDRRQMGGSRPARDRLRRPADVHRIAGPPRRRLRRLRRSISLLEINVDTTDKVGLAWDQALAADRPVLLDIRCDPDVPPIPPHASFAQMKSLSSAVLKGDEDAGHLVKEGIKQKVQQYVPGHKDG